jgi:hypothetical protein
MRRSRAIIAALSVLLILPLMGAAAQEAPSGPEHTVFCNEPAATNYALMQRLSDAGYRIAGSGSCGTWVDSISIRCWAVHRHALSWHSHTSTTISDTNYDVARVTVGWASWPGSNGNRYKTHCDMSAWHGTTTRWSKESPSVVL